MDLHEMWSENDPEKAWNKLIKGSNNICNYYAPGRVIQRKANFQPYINDEIRDVEEKVKLAFQNATTTKNQEAWKN